MKYIKILDVVFIVFVLLVSSFSFLHVFSNRSENSLLVVNSPNGEYVYPLEKNMRLEVQGVLGATTIEIKDYAAFVVDSPCKNKSCVSSARIKSHGEWIACLPNKIFMHIAAEQKDFDAVSK